MKVLSVQQPWATLICSGIKDIENRSWKPANNPGKILIHASKKLTMGVLSGLPLEWLEPVLNHIRYGNVPTIKDFPAGSIIGYVELESIETESQSLWAAPGSEYYWKLKDAYLFDEPIEGIKGKLHLFDYDLDENNLPPAHKVEVRLPYRDGDEIVFPVNKVSFDECKSWIGNNKECFEIGIDTINGDVICKPNTYKLQPVQSIRFEYGDESQRFEVLTTSESYFDSEKDGSPRMWFSMFEEKGVNRVLAAFDIGSHL